MNHCECGCREDQHSHMNDKTGPCLRCNCSGFVPQSAMEIPDVDPGDFERVRNDLMRRSAS